MIKWLLAKLFNKCNHPIKYRMSAWQVPPPKNKDVYWCSLCKTIYLVERVIKPIRSDIDGR